MTGQDILDLMEVMDQELELQTGEDDVANGLLALNVSQNMFEVVAASHKKFKGGQTTTVTTTASTETTTFPTGFLRIDRLQLLDASTLLPTRDLIDISDEGGHRVSSMWPLNLTSTTATGAPVGYYVDGTNIYWDPLPDGTRTVRVYGFKAAATLAAGTTLTYDDVVGNALAAYAVRVIRSGKDDPADLEMARELFDPIIQALKGFNRSGFNRPRYTRVHDC